MKIGGRIGIAAIIISITGFILSASSWTIHDWKFWIILSVATLIGGLIVFLKSFTENERTKNKFNHMNAISKTNVRDWAFLEIANRNIGYPEWISNESRKHRPQGHNVWKIENFDQAKKRADNLENLGLLMWHGNEVGPTKNGSNFLDYLKEDKKFKPNY